MMRRFIYILLVSCTPDVPAIPRFQRDVMPILAANCVRCHSTEPLSAPANMRLDTYGDLELRAAELDKMDPICIETKDDPDPRCRSTNLLGAATYAGLIAERIVDEDRPMPPRFGLDSYQIEILQSWAEAEAPQGRGRRDNQLPTARIDAIDGTVIDIVVSDPDRDLVGGALVVEVVIDGVTKELVIGAIAGGRMQLTWDTEDVVPGTHALRAKIDDGAGVVTVELGTITVEAP